MLGLRRCRRGVPHRRRGREPHGAARLLDDRTVTQVPVAGRRDRGDDRRRDTSQSRRQETELLGALSCGHYEAEPILRTGPAAATTATMARAATAFSSGPVSGVPTAITRLSARSVITTRSTNRTKRSMRQIVEPSTRDADPRRGRIHDSRQKKTRGRRVRDACVTRDLCRPADSEPTSRPAAGLHSPGGSGGGGRGWGRVGWWCGRGLGGW